MDQQQQPSQSPAMSVLGRRDFLKLAGMLGLSAGALEALFAQQGSAFAASSDISSGLVGYWKFDDGSGTTAADASGNGNNGTLNGGATWTSGRIGGAISFNGSSSTVDINKAVLNTSGDYSVAAWVQLNDTSKWATAVSQDGNAVSGFFLQYTNPTVGADGGKFAFSLLSADSTSGVPTRATSSFNPTTGTWYHIVGVHDSTNNQIKLYVDGSLMSTKSVGAAWNATGETVIGRGKFNGATDFWPGVIDDVHVYNRVLSDQDVMGLYSAAPSIPAPYTPIRPPATPLFVRGPYANAWLAGDVLPRKWATFWNGVIKAVAGIARIDGIAYVFLGDPGNIGATQTMAQVNLTVTPTQSIFTLQGGGVTLTLTFLSPVEANDLQRLSVPFSYIFAQAQSNDGRSHDVSLYFDISGEWAHGNTSAQINWGREDVLHAQGFLNVFTVTPASPQVLTEYNDYPSWGTVIWATHKQSHMTFQSGADIDVRSLAVLKGQLNNTMDTNMPRAINDHWPVFAFNFDLGSVANKPSDQLTLVLGHVREPAVSYLGNNVSSLWKSYWSRWEDMLAFFYDDADATLGRANALDKQITSAATNAGGANYAALAALALRQAFGGVELVGTAAKPWLFLKEISSSGNVSTVDVVYPCMPVFYYTNPYLLRLLLDPILAYTESGKWPQTFCVHDLGSSYPNASGHNDGGGENMPVEETSNMLIMAAAYIQQASSSDATVYAQAHYTIFKQWADYLNAPNGANPSRPNALDPLYQNQTDDFTGSIAHCTNLALKGILGIGAMGIIARAAGKSSDQRFYSSTAANLIGQWAQLGQDATQPHLDIAYTESDTAPGTGSGTYSLKYNAFPDKLLGLNLVPSSVIQEEDAWYAGKENQYGIPLDTRHTYTKADWEMWTAASSSDPKLRQYFVDALYTFANTTSSRVPFTDWYDTIADSQDGFKARPVIGGLFSILARIKSGN